MVDRPGFPEICIYPDASLLAQAAVQSIIDSAARAIAACGRFSLALAGGSTPRAAYELLSQEAYAAQVDWAHTQIFWGDERCVPPDHPDSNYRMARQALLDCVPVPPGNIHRMRGEDEPQRAAESYEQELRAFFTPGQPYFDLVLLGLGEDGHTASLFPGAAAIHEQERWAVAYYVDKLSAWRLTLTPPALNAAAQITFLVSGASKADRLVQVLCAPYQPDVLPAQVVRPVSGRLVWLLDQPAWVRLGD
jgi:6-phosphogluconolactonase